MAGLRGFAPVVAAILATGAQTRAQVQPDIDDLGFQVVYTDAQSDVRFDLDVAAWKGNAEGQNQFEVVATGTARENASLPAGHEFPVRAMLNLAPAPLGSTMMVGPSLQVVIDAQHGYLVSDTYDVQTDIHSLVVTTLEGVDLANFAVKFDDNARWTAGARLSLGWRLFATISSGYNAPGDPTDPPTFSPCLLAAIDTCQTAGGVCSFRYVWSSGTCEFECCGVN